MSLASQLWSWQVVGGAVVLFVSLSGTWLTTEHFVSRLMFVVGALLLGMKLVPWLLSPSAPDAPLTRAAIAFVLFGLLGAGFVYIWVRTGEFAKVASANAPLRPPAPTPSLPSPTGPVAEASPSRPPSRKMAAPATAPPTLATPSRLPPVVSGPGSIVTQGQSGGSNTITNTFLTPPRWGLTPDQERSLVEALRGTHGDVRVVAVAMGDAESIQFATQIIEAFRAVGWELRGRKGPDHQLLQPAPPRGIVIRVSSADVIRNDPALLAFHNAMRALGFPVMAGIREMQDEGIEIFIGPRPLQ